MAVGTFNDNNLQSPGIFKDAFLYLDAKIRSRSTNYHGGRVGHSACIENALSISLLRRTSEHSQPLVEPRGQNDRWLWFFLTHVDETWFALSLSHMGKLRRFPHP